MTNSNNNNCLHGNIMIDVVEKDNRNLMVLSLKRATTTTWLLEGGLEN